jgi:hypothetical protein
MAVLTSLKLIAAKRINVVDPVQHRRTKLMGKLQEQIDLCEHHKAGERYAPIKVRNVIDKATGERKAIQVTKRVREWFWVSETNKINLSIKYGSHTIYLNKKGATAIELSNGDELIATLKTIKQAVSEGEFDDALNDASKATRQGFGK